MNIKRTTASAINSKGMIYFMQIITLVKHQQMTRIGRVKASYLMRLIKSALKEDRKFKSHN